MTLRKSSYSDPEQSCVEVGHTAASLGVRDPKLDDSPADHGKAFLGTVQAGRFDL